MREFGRSAFVALLAGVAGIGDLPKAHGAARGRQEYNAGGVRRIPERTDRELSDRLNRREIAASYFGFRDSLEVHIRRLRNEETSNSEYWKKLGTLPEEHTKDAERAFQLLLRIDYDLAAVGQELAKHPPKQETVEGPYTFHPDIVAWMREANWKLKRFLDMPEMFRDAALHRMLEEVRKQKSQ